MWMWGVLIMERGGRQQQNLNNNSNINNGRKTSTTSQAISMAAPSTGPAIEGSKGILALYN